jgi:hypothetical protein
MSVYFKHWKNVYFKKPRPLLFALALIAINMLMNSNIIVTFGWDGRLNQNESVSSFCFEVDGLPSTHWMTAWGKVILI